MGFGAKASVALACSGTDSNLQKHTHMMSYNTSMP